MPAVSWNRILFHLCVWLWDISHARSLGTCDAFPVYSILSTLRSLVALNENLKKQEQEFKAHCKVK